MLHEFMNTRIRGKGIRHIMEPAEQQGGALDARLKLDKGSYMKAVSKLMLEGWSLTGRTCPLPSCEHCAILSKKATGEVHCASCGNYFVNEKEATQLHSAPPALEAGPTNVQGSDDEGNFDLEAEDPFEAEGGYDPYAEPTAEQAASALKLDEGTKKMGELMLSGWSMLAEACPNQSCQGLPLMRKKGTTTSMCVLCDEDETSGGPASAATEVTVPPPAAPPASTSVIKRAPPPTPADLARLRAAAAAKTSGNTQASPSLSAVAGKAPFDPLKEDATQVVVHKTPSETSSLLGNKLLAGWRMLGEVCPDPHCRGTPLMVLAAKPKLCVCCGAEYDPNSNEKLGGDALVAPPPAPAKATSSPAPGATSAPSTAKAVPAYVPPNKRKASETPLEDSEWQKTQEETSALLGVKMLAGWAMLSAPCPNSACRGTPLLQRKGKLPKLCVCCSAEYDNHGNQTNGSDGKTTNGNASTSSSNATDGAQLSSVVPPPEQPRNLDRSVNIDDRASSRLPTQPSKTMSAFEVAAASVSKHLVKGWALHAQECPTCSAPTMSHAAPTSQGGSAGAKVCVNANCSAAAVTKDDKAKVNGAAAAPAASESGYESDKDNGEDDDDNEVLGTGMDLMSSPDYAAAEAAYRAQRFGAKSQPLPPPPPAPALGATRISAPAAPPPRQSPEQSRSSLEAPTMAAARARAAAAVAAKLHWCAEVLESTSSSSSSSSSFDLQRESHAADLMLKLVQTANALREGGP